MSNHGFDCALPVFPFNVSEKPLVRLFPVALPKRGPGRGTGFRGRRKTEREGKGETEGELEINI